MPTVPMRDIETFANVEIKQPPNILSSHQRKKEVTHSVMSKPSPVRELGLNVKDIEGAEPKKFFKGEIYNKNRELLSDSVLGRRKHYHKETNPVDPTYLMRSVSGKHLHEIGEVGGSKPKVLIQQVVKKDNHRHLRTEDINGASPKVHSIKRIVEIDDAEKRYNSYRVNEQIQAIKDGQVVPNFVKRQAYKRFNLEGSLKKLEDEEREE